MIKDEPFLTIKLTEMDDDWIRGTRLKKKAMKGDKKAQKELNRMEETRLYPIPNNKIEKGA